MIHFYYIISQNPFKQGSGFDSFIEGRGFLFLFKESIIKNNFGSSHCLTLDLWPQGDILAREILVLPTNLKWRSLDT